MNSGLIIVGQVLTLFFLLAVGLFMTRKGWIKDGGIATMNTLVMQITMPCMIVASFQMDYEPEILRELAAVLAVSLVAHGMLVLLGKLITRRYPRAVRQVFWYVLVFTNCAYMGYPLIEGLYGKMGVLYASIYVIGFNLYCWTVGVGIFSDKGGGLKRALLNPGTLSVVVGLILFLARLRLPGPVNSAVTLLGNMTTPLSMLIVGARLGEVKPRELFAGRTIYLASLLRLVVIPLAGYGALYLLGLRGLTLAIPVICMAMPAAAATQMFAEQFGGDGRLASRFVAMTTGFSLATIPVLMSLLPM